jgi:hypothetical protein
MPMETGSAASLQPATYEPLELAGPVPLSPFSWIQTRLAPAQQSCQINGRGFCGHRCRLHSMGVLRATTGEATFESEAHGL